MKINSKGVVLRFIQEMFFQIVFEGIKIVNTLDCVRVLNQYKTNQTEHCQSFETVTLIFENQLSIE